MESNDRTIVGFTMLAHAMFHTYELSIPIFVVAWLDAFATTEATLGLVVGLGYALVGVGAVPGGVLSDRYGSKLPVLLAVSGMGVGFLLLALSPNVLVLAGALMVWGAAASLYHPAGLALLSRGTSEDQRGTAFAYHGAAGNVGTVVGPLLAAVLLALYDWRVVAAAFVLPAVGAGLLAWRLSFDEAAGGEAAAEASAGTEAADGGVETDGGDDALDDDALEDDALDDGDAASNDGGVLAGLQAFAAATRRMVTPGFLVVFGVVMLYGVYYRGILTFLPEILGGLTLFEPVTLFDREFPPSRYVYAGLLLVGVAGQYAGGKLTDRMATERALLGSFVVLGVAALAFLPASAAGVLPLLGVCVVLGFFIYLVAPVYQATIADYVAADTRGLSYGYTYLGMFGIGALGAVVSGAALTYATPATLFTALAGFAAVCAGLSFYLDRRRLRGGGRDGGTR